MTRLLITGAKGQLGADLVAAGGADAVGYGSAELDITDAEQVRRMLGGFADDGPGVVINSAAYTAVDKAESEAERADAVNHLGAATVARAAAELGLGLIHVSTDYVFPGDGTRPYRPQDPTGPKSVYGRTKLAGEQAVRAAHPDAQVVRTSWVYGATGANFVKTMARLEASRDTLTVVDDQRGAPTWTVQLAAGLVELAAAGLPGGVLHASGGGETTWCGFARAIFAELGADPERVRPISTADYPVPAPRPAYSVLSGEEWAAAGLTPLPQWRDALAAAFAAHRSAFVPA